MAVREERNRFIVQIKLDGVRHYKSFKDERSAKAHEALLKLRAFEKPERQPGERITFHDWAQRWIEEQEGKCRPSTLKSYRRVLLGASRMTRFRWQGSEDLWKGSLEHFGFLGIEMVQPLDVYNLFSLRHLTHKKTTLHTWMAILSACFEAAVVRGLIPKNPCKRVGRELGLRPRHEAPLEIPYEHEVSELLKRLRDSSGVARTIYGPAACMALAGLRQGEALSLKWRDFSEGSLAANGPRGSVTVSRTAVRSDGTGPTKGGRARTVPLSPTLAEILRSVSDPRSGSEWFFFPELEQAGKGSTIVGKLQGRCDAAIREAAKAEGFHCASHTLRHYFASRCLLRGESPESVRRWLGHADISTTIRAYSHLTMNQSEALDALGEASRPAPRQDP